MEITFTQIHSVVNFTCLHVTVYSVSLSSDLKGRKIT